MLSAFEDVLDGYHHFGTARVSRDPARGAELPGAGTVQRTLGYTQNEYLGLRATATSRLQDGNGAILGKTGIEDHQSPRMCIDPIHGFVFSSRLTKDDVPVLATKYQLKALTNEDMITNNQYGQLVCL